MLQKHKLLMFIHKTNVRKQQKSRKDIRDKTDVQKHWSIGCHIGQDGLSANSSLSSMDIHHFRPMFQTIKIDINANTHSCKWSDFKLYCDLSTGASNSAILPL